MAELAFFSETSRQRAFERFQLLRAHIEDGRPLVAIAREAKLSYRTLQYWLERYQTSAWPRLRVSRGADRLRPEGSPRSFVAYRGCFTDLHRGWLETPFKVLQYI